MISPISDRQPSEQFGRLLSVQTLHAGAVRDNDIPRANRLFLKVAAVLEQLSSTAAGRRALEDHLGTSNAYLRLWVASEVVKWAPDIAIPILGRLSFEDLGEISADERIEIRITANGLLRNHLGIRSFDRNDLIEPLRAYGVEMPVRDHAQWR